MHLEDQISKYISEFATIYMTISSNDYSDELKDEMYNLLQAQTEQNHLALINSFFKGNMNLGDLSDAVWECVEKVNTQDSRVKEIFLEMFDHSIDIFEKSKPKGVEINKDDSLMNSKDKEHLEVARKKVECLVRENEILKSELEEKLATIERMVSNKDQIDIVKTCLLKSEEKCSYLLQENNGLKVQVTKCREEMDAQLAQFKVKEEKLICEVEEMNEVVADKEALLKLCEKERGSMLADIELLREELVDRDHVIQSLNVFSSGKDIEVTNSDTNLDISRPINLTIDSRDESFVERKGVSKCEMCARRRESSLFFGQIKSPIPRRLITPTSSSGFDDSFNSSIPQVVDFSRTKTKSLSDELMEAKANDEEENKWQLLEDIVERLDRVEVELSKRRKDFKLSFDALLHRLNHPKGIKIRHRVKNKQVTKMQFSRYEGVRLPS